VPTSPLEAAAPRRRPGAEEASLAAQVRPAPSRQSEAAPRRQYSAPSFAEIGVRPVGEGGAPPQRYAAATQSGGAAPAWPTPVLDERQNSYPTRPSPPPPAMPRPSPNEYPRQDNSQSPGFTLVPQGRPFGKPPEAEAEAERPAPPLADFSIVTSAVNSLEDERSAAPPPVPAPVRSQPARTTRTAEARPAPTSNSRSSRTRQTPAQANPSRVWVQVATGSNRAGLLYTYGQFRRRASALLGNKAAFTAPNRLLVGPFPNESAANSFARQLSANGVPSHSWTSEAGQRIDQLQAAADDDSRSSSRTRTAASERSGSGSRNARGSTGSRSERNSSRTERTAANSSGRDRNGTASSRTGNSRTASNGGRTGTSTSRNGRNSAGNSRTASTGSSRDRSGSGRSGARGSKPTSTASARSSRGGSSGQSRTPSRRGR
jgi:hypothetical protein